VWTEIAPPQNDKPTFINAKEHSLGCKMIGSGPILMMDLDIIMQDFVLECPHRSHDSVKFIFMVSCPSELSEKIEEGKLF
jgi:hypothetical protein